MTGRHAERTPADLAGVLTERAFSDRVIALAKLCGWTVYHTWNAQHSAAGFPDLVLLRPPRVVFAELKTARGRLSLAQQAWHAQLAACPGVEAFVWRPADLDQIVATLAPAGAARCGESSRANIDRGCIVSR